MTSSNRQLDEQRSQAADLKKYEATMRSDQQKNDELQRKLKSESDSVMKLRKAQQDLKKVRAVVQACVECVGILALFLLLVVLSRLDIGDLFYLYNVTLNETYLVRYKNLLVLRIIFV